MNDNRIARRRFILAALTLSGAALGSQGFGWLRAGRAWAESNADAAEAAMVDLGRALFPHDGMPEKTYREVMGAVLAALAENPDTDGLAATAERALDARRDSPFVELDEAGQVAVIAEIQGEPFFATLLAVVRGVFYYHPRVWQHIDYPGSSKELGGYINRGFDDIDWLPEDA
jgi:hypothetical protein